MSTVKKYRERKADGEMTSTVFDTQTRTPSQDEKEVKLKAPVDAGPAELESDLPDFYRSLPEILNGLSRAEIDNLERRLVRRLDLSMIPVLIIMFVLNIIDRNGLTNARLGSLEKDLGLRSTEYQTVLMILYVGYLLAQVPSNAILPNTRPSLYLPGCMILWGTVSACSGATHNFAGIFACRFFIGFLEAPFLPGVTFLMSCWYRRSELPMRIALLYCGNSLSNAFGGLFAAGIINNLDGVGGLSSWRYIFIIEGAATVFVASFALFLLPDWPETTRWLSEQQRAIALHRVRCDAAGQSDDDTEANGNWRSSIKNALTDPLAWLLVLLQHALLITQSFTYFFPSIVETLGFNRVQTLLLTVPPYFFAFLCSIANAFHAGRTNERFWHISLPMIVSLAGNILVSNLTSVGGRYTAMFMQCAGPYMAFSLVVSWISSSMPRPKGKRAVTIALANAFGNASHLYTSYIFPKSEAPRYLNGAIVIVVFSGVLIITSFALRTVLKKRNERYGRDPTSNPIGDGFQYTI